MGVVFIYLLDACEHDRNGESIDFPNVIEMLFCSSFSSEFVWLKQGNRAKAVAAYIDISDDYITEPEKAWRASGMGMSTGLEIPNWHPRIWFVAFCIIL